MTIIAKCLKIILANCALLLSGNVVAQTPQAPSAAASGRAPANDLPEGGIPLSAGRHAGPATEQWIIYDGSRRLINVTEATLTPFLPPAGRQTGAGIIIAPGGGFIHLAIDKAGYNVARWLADHGIAAFVLKYRTRPYDEALAEMRARAGAGAPGVAPGGAPRSLVFAPAIEDGKAALQLVRDRAASFGVDPSRIGMMGFSAGAALTMEMAIGPGVEVRPAFIAPIYGSLAAREVPAGAPPMFVAIAADDNIVPPSDFGLIQSWRAAKRPVEMHLYEKGGHGFGVPGVEGTTTTAMMDQLYLWLKSNGSLGNPKKE